MFNRVIDNGGTIYPADLVGELAFQDIYGAGADFVNAGAKDFNLQATSPAKNTSPLLTNIGAMSDIEASGGGGGYVGSHSKTGGKQ